MKARRDLLYLVKPELLHLVYYQFFFHIIGVAHLVAPPKIMGSISSVGAWII